MNIKCKEFGRLVSEKYEKMYEQSRRIYSADGLSPTIHTMQGGGNQELKVAIAKCIGGIGEMKSNGGKQYYQQDRVYQGDIALARPASIPGGSYHYAVGERNYRIRKLTPKECWRLMGFDDTDFEKAEKVCSNTQLYKQAGNSIVVNVLEGILKNLLPQQSRSEWLDELLGGGE